MTHVTCSMTAKNRDHLRNPTLDNGVWATFTLFSTRCIPAPVCAGVRSVGRCCAKVTWPTVSTSSFRGRCLSTSTRTITRYSRRSGSSRCAREPCSGSVGRFVRERNGNRHLKHALLAVVAACYMVLWNQLYAHGDSDVI